MSTTPPDHDPRITEQRNPRTADIDLADPLAIVDLLSAEDAGVPAAVASQREAIAAVIAAVERSLRSGGRLFYVGAGTSGRLGVLDASEIPPTFGADPSFVQGIIAGGPAALTRAQEGAEDNVADGGRQIDAHGVNSGDVVIGIAASGTTPWVRSALERARKLGAVTALVACSPPPAETLAVVDHPIVVVVGAEAVTGSTRMKAGTATKLVLNTITTGAMIRLGKTYGNLMVDLRATNEKLRDRSERIVMEVAGLSRDAARELLTRAKGHVKLALVMNALNVDAALAEQKLREAGGVVRRVMPATERSASPRSASPRSASPRPAIRRPALLRSATLVGVMSGTSLDGITAAVARFHAAPDGYDAELLGFETLPYPDDVRERLAAAVTSATAAEYSALAFTLGERLATAAAAVIASAGVARDDIAAVATHGHTIWHAPPAGTWQLGEGAVIAERLGIDVIEGFRVRDVAAGGQGAPLVPIADALLFGRHDAARALQNIGGIGNVTIVPRRGDTAGVRAFDTGPGVMLIDALTQTLVGDRFDRDGAYGRLGRPVTSVVEKLLAADYFRREPPKSTGRELFGTQYALEMLAACRSAQPECSDADVIATATELTARSIADAYTRFIPEPVADVLLSGGGAANAYLVERISALLAPLSTRRFEHEFFPSEAKEAVAFAFLGFLHLRGEAGNVAQATGARGPRILGKRIPA